MPHPTSVFNADDERKIQSMLENLVRALRVVPGGGKIEEDYWSYIYNTVRDAPTGGWSNLTMRDYCHAGLGVEMKLLQRRSPFADQGKTLMHPSATRALNFDPTKGAEACKDQVLRQFGRLISDFRTRVNATCEGTKPDIRWGILLWSKTLEEFLYFEEYMVEPNPDEFYAEFVKGLHRGIERKNLYIYEKASGIKRYSVTMPEKGAKLQPYFDIPQIGKGAFAFRVPDDGRKPLWLKSETITALQTLVEKHELDEFLLASLQERSSKQK